MVSLHSYLGCLRPVTAHFIMVGHTKLNTSCQLRSQREKEMDKNPIMALKEKPPVA